MQKQLLFLDDDPVYVELVKDLAFTRNYLALAASDGVTALRLLEAHTIDLIISDAGDHAVPFLRDIRSDQRFYHIPFVVLAGPSHSALRQELDGEPNVKLVNKADIVTELLALLSHEPSPPEESSDK